jgi:hypothetical protein
MRKLLRRAAIVTVAGVLTVLAAATPAMADIAYTSGNPARSVVVHITNATGCDFNWSSEHIYSGMFFNDPQMQGPMNGSYGPASVVVSSESNGFMTGTQADVTYKIGVWCQEGSPAWYGTYIFKFAWNNPYAGSNSYSTAGTTSNLHVTRTGGSGDNATVYITLTLA